MGGRGVEVGGDGGCGVDVGYMGWVSVDTEGYGGRWGAVGWMWGTRGRGAEPRGWRSVAAQQHGAVEPGVVLGSLRGFDAGAQPANPHIWGARLAPIAPQPPDAPPALQRGAVGAEESGVVGGRVVPQPPGRLHAEAEGNDAGRARAALGWEPLPPAGGERGTQ